MHYHSDTPAVARRLRGLVAGDGTSTAVAITAADRSGLAPAHKRDMTVVTFVASTTVPKGISHKD